MNSLNAPRPLYETLPRLAAGHRPLPPLGGSFPPPPKPTSSASLNCARRPSAPSASAPNAVSLPSNAHKTLAIARNEEYNPISLDQMRRFGMRRLGILALIFVILLGGGAISSNLLSSDLTIQQTTDPNGDALTATPDQAAAFILIVGFIVMNVIGARADLDPGPVAAQPSSDRRPTRNPSPHPDDSARMAFVNQQKQPSRPNSFIALSLATALFTLGLIVFGAVVRVTDSGLGLRQRMAALSWHYLSAAGQPGRLD